MTDLKWKQDWKQNFNKHSCRHRLLARHQLWPMRFLDWIPGWVNANLQYATFYDNLFQRSATRFATVLLDTFLSFWRHFRCATWLALMRDSTFHTKPKPCPSQVIPRSRAGSQSQDRYPKLTLSHQQQTRDIPVWKRYYLVIMTTNKIPHWES